LYVDVWQTPLRVELGGLLHLDHLSLQTWVNDALMTVFFLLVGVEIKREIVHGELRDPRALALPVIAALGGMIVPAAIYASLNAGGPGSDGWAVPMATDIAFAVGIVTLAGKRVPLAAKIFLPTLAVADDIGAIVVIAVFYTGALSWGWFACALGSLTGIFVLRRSSLTVRVCQAVQSSSSPGLSSRSAAHASAITARQPVGSSSSATRRAKAVRPASARTHPPNGPTLYVMSRPN
jgi:Na+:H+ antiporter, NhaA family